MQTIKLPFTTDKKERIFEIQKEQSRLIGKCYQFLKSNPNQTTVTQFLNKQNTSLDSWMKQSAYYDAKAMLKADMELGKFRLFGGKKNLSKYKNGEITKEQFTNNRVMPIFVVGEGPQRGNRKFKIDLDENVIRFKLNRNELIELKLPTIRKNYKKQLEQLQYLAEQKTISITFRLDQEFVYISYDAPVIEKVNGNNVLGIDLNPNYIGVSIQSQKQNILFSRVYDIKQLTNANKQKHELSLIAKDLIKIAKAQGVKVISIEDLSVESKNHKKGKVFNKTVNNKWNRNDFVNYITKRANVLGIIVKKTLPHYSSFVGNIKNKGYCDPVASSIELGRRAVTGQTFYPTLLHNDILMKQLPELLLKCVSWKQLFDLMKKEFPDMRYRNSLPNKGSFKTHLHYASRVLKHNGVI